MRWPGDLVLRAETAITNERRRVRLLPVSPAASGKTAMTKAAVAKPSAGKAVCVKFAAIDTVTRPAEAVVKPAAIEEEGIVVGVGIAVPVGIGARKRIPIRVDRRVARWIDAHRIAT